MRKIVRQVSFSTFLAVLMALTLLMISTRTVVKADNNHSEQIVFSGVGTFTSGGLTDTPFGFWVWCQNEGSGNGIYGKDKACQGAMYIYALGITKSVFGFPAVGGGVTEKGDGTYTMDVHSPDGIIAAKLTNALPVKQGPKNTVNVDFTAPAAASGAGSPDGTYTNAVVIVTGKE